MNDLETQNASFKAEYCTQRVFSDSCYKLQLQPSDRKAYLNPDLRQAKKVSLFSLSGSQIILMTIMIIEFVKDEGLPVDVWPPARAVTVHKEDLGE